jgi:ABC-type branched-subunit amino acid transport system substrate-binding protein/TolA-binding protein
MFNAQDGGLRAPLWLTFLFLAFAVCAEAAATETASPVGADDFSRARHYFLSGQFEDAHPLYEKYLRENPRGKHAARAYYHLGRIEQRSRSFVTALQYYQRLLSEFPRDRLRDEVGFQMGRCYLELGQYAEAEYRFQQVLRSTRDRKRQWQALYLQARAEQGLLDYEGAIEKFRQVAEQDPFPKVQSQARALIDKIIERILSGGQIDALAARYGDKFPADRLLLKLVALKREQRDLAGFQAAIARFLNLFPDADESARLARWLEASGPEEAGPPRLGVILPLTGKLAVTGQQVLQGIHLRISEQDGEEPLALEIRDSAAGRPVAELVEELAADPRVVGLLGPVTSQEVQEIAPLAERYKIPVFTPTASSPDLAGRSPYIFRNALTRGAQAQFLAKHAVNRLHLRRFAILFPRESFGIELKEIFQHEVEALGAEVVATVPYDRSQTDFKKQILALGGISDEELDRLARDKTLGLETAPPLGRAGVLSRPRVNMGLWEGEDIADINTVLELAYDAIFIPGYYDKVGLILPQLAFYNIEHVALLGSREWNSPELVRLAGRYLGGGTFLDGFFADSPMPRVRGFVDRFRKNFGETPGVYSAQAYDAAGLFIEAVKGGAGNRLEVKEALAKFKGFPGVSGVLTILPSGDVERELFTLQVRHNAIVQENADIPDEVPPSAEATDPKG